MELLFLGTGTSQGVPMIGCRCAVCLSDDPRDRRTRSSAAVRLDDGRVILIDTTPELRVQALAHGLDRVDAVLFTHAHADHIMGADDLRSYNQWQQTVLPCYGGPATIEAIRRVFGYAEVAPGGRRLADRPGLELRQVDGPFELFGQPITPVPLLHASTGSLGYRIGPLAYCTDCSAVPEASFDLLAGVRVLVLGMLRHRPHPAHMTVAQALATAERVAAEQTWFVHMCHDLGHAATNAQLPPDKQLAHDGLVVRIPTD